MDIIEKSTMFSFSGAMEFLPLGKILLRPLFFVATHWGSPTKACNPHKEWCRGRGRLVDCVKKLVPSRRTIAEMVFLVIKPKNGFCD